MCYIDTGDNYKTWLNDARRAVYVLLPHLKANVAPQGGSDIPAPPVKTPTQKLNDEMAIVDLMMRAYDNSGFCHIGTYSTPSAMRAVYRSVVAHLLTEPAKDVRELVEAAYREGIIDGIARQCDIHSLSQKEENALIKQAWGESEARHNLSRFAAKPEASVEGHHE
jgi:hypothetical protein